MTTPTFPTFVPAEIPLELARLTLAHAIDADGRAQRAIAGAAGMRPNVLSMMRTGAMPIPLDRVPALARELALDETTFSLQVLRDTNDAWWCQIAPILVCNQYEAAMLEVNRIRRRRAGLTSATPLPEAKPAAVIAAALEVGAKSATAVAADTAVERNVISLMKAGEMAVPMERARGLARALGLEDEVVFLHQVLREVKPELYAALRPRLAADRLEAGLLLVSRRQEVALTAA